MLEFPDLAYDANLTVGPDLIATFIPTNAAVPADLAQAKPTCGGGQPEVPLRRREALV